MQARRKQLSDQLQGLWSDVPAWTATMLFMFQPVAQSVSSLLVLSLHCAAPWSIFVGMCPCLSGCCHIDAAAFLMCTLLIHTMLLIQTLGPHSRLHDIESHKASIPRLPWLSNIVLHCDIGNMAFKLCLFLGVKLQKSQHPGRAFYG